MHNLNVGKSELQKRLAFSRDLCYKLVVQRLFIIPYTILAYMLMSSLKFQQHARSFFCFFFFILKKKCSNTREHPKKDLALTDE
jgi:hypothetical protein